MSYRVIITDSQLDEEIELLKGTVTRVKCVKRGVMALVTVPHGREYKFWVRRPDSPGGARCYVTAQKGKSLPTILHRKKDFDVSVGLEVLFRRPKRTSAAFPVILYEDYEAAVRAIKDGQTFTAKNSSELPLKKGQHRFVD